MRGTTSIASIVAIAPATATRAARNPIRRVVTRRRLFTAAVVGRLGDDGAEEAEGSQDGSHLEQHVVALGVQGGVVRFGLRLGLVERFSWC